MNLTEVSIEELEDSGDWQKAVIVLKVLRPKLELDQVLRRRESLLEEGYRLLGVRLGESIVSVASFTISPHLTLNRELLVHDMATLPEFSCQGYASKILEKLQAIAVYEKCGRIFVHTRQAQKFYLKNGFQEYSTGMVKIS